MFLGKNTSERAPAICPGGQPLVIATGAATFGTGATADGTGDAPVDLVVRAVTEAPGKGGKLRAIGCQPVMFTVTVLSGLGGGACASSGFTTESEEEILVSANGTVDLPAGLYWSKITATVVDAAGDAVAAAPKDVIAQASSMYSEDSAECQQVSSASGSGGGGGGGGNAVALPAHVNVTETNGEYVKTSGVGNSWYDTLLDAPALAAGVAGYVQFQFVEGTNFANAGLMPAALATSNNGLTRMGAHVTSTSNKVMYYSRSNTLIETLSTASMPSTTVYRIERRMPTGETVILVDGVEFVPSNSTTVTDTGEMRFSVALYNIGSGVKNVSYGTL